MNFVVVLIAAALLTECATVKPKRHVRHRHAFIAPATVTQPEPTPIPPLPDATATSENKLRQRAKELNPAKD